MASTCERVAIVQLRIGLVDTLVDASSRPFPRVRTPVDVDLVGARESLRLRVIPSPSKVACNSPLLERAAISRPFGVEFSSSAISAVNCSRVTPMSRTLGNRPESLTGVPAFAHLAPLPFGSGGRLSLAPFAGGSSCRVRSRSVGLPVSVLPVDRRGPLSLVHFFLGPCPLPLPLPEAIPASIATFISAPKNARPASRNPA